MALYIWLGPWSSAVYMDLTAIVNYRGNADGGLGTAQDTYYPYFLKIVYKPTQGGFAQGRLNQIVNTIHDTVVIYSGIVPIILLMVPRIAKLLEKQLGSIQQYTIQPQ